jgi:septal ring factor EnvC (AmiA/AmiB activator)
MRVLPSLAAIGILLGAPAWAATPPSVAHASSTAAEVPPTMRQRMQHDQVEVTRLQKEVARQESASQRASRQLEQQDAKIAELRRQLSQLRAESPADQP